MEAEEVTHDPRVFPYMAVSCSYHNKVTWTTIAVILKLSFFKYLYYIFYD